MYFYKKWLQRHQLSSYQYKHENPDNHATYVLDLNVVLETVLSAGKEGYKKRQILGNEI